MHTVHTYIHTYIYNVDVYEQCLYYVHALCSWPSLQYRTLQASSRATTADTLTTRPGTSAVEHVHGEGEPLGKRDLPGVSKARPARLSKAIEKAEARRIKKVARQKQASRELELCSPVHD